MRRSMILEILRGPGEAMSIPAAIFSRSIPLPAEDRLGFFLNWRLVLCILSQWRSFVTPQKSSGK